MVRDVFGESSPRSTLEYALVTLIEAGVEDLLREEERVSIPVGDWSQLVVTESFQGANDCYFF